MRLTAAVRADKTDNAEAHLSPKLGLRFNATDSHRTPNAYTVLQERWYFISPQLFDLNQKIDLNLVTLLSFQLLEFSS